MVGLRFPRSLRSPGTRVSGWWSFLTGLQTKRVWDYRFGEANTATKNNAVASSVIVDPDGKSKA